MNNYYVSILNWDAPTAQIIDEQTLDAAERGENYINPDDFMWLCEAESMEAAEEIRWKEASDSMFQKLAEANHP